ncbi:MAG TPA: hypothetical protein PKD86_17725 [Gemmatales bacterium]|nr:hypothetical protein [Gemmatales bacterium]HMP61187.1 hypothetical protein [Gemmatales bacterium]
MSRRCLVALLVLWPLAAGGLADSPPPASLVFQPPRPSQDGRLRDRDHLDRPVLFKPAFASRAEWERRRAELRRQVLVAAGLWPLPPRTPLEPVVHGRIDRGDYTVEKVIISSLPGHRVTGSLYRPKQPTGRRAAILMPHGHHAQGRFNRASDAEVKRDQASGAENTEQSARYPLQARCALLARLGCVVFHYDMIGYADSKALDHRGGFADVAAELRQQSILGLQTWNSIRALDFLCGLPDVDPERIGVTGGSGGGTQTFLLCAIDDRPAAAAPAVMVSMNMQGGCICENVSHLRVGTNNVELAALFAPRPLFLTGADDWTRDIESRGLPELRTIYGLYDAADQVVAKYLPFPHNYNQRSGELIAAWFNRHLRLGHAEPIQEQPFEPIPSEELSVWAGAPEMPTPLRATELKTRLDAQAQDALQELALSGADYRPVVATGWRALLHTELPVPGSTQAEQVGFERQDGYGIWRGTQKRRGTSEEVPLISLVPSGSRRAVVWLHGAGKASLFQADGTLRPEVQRLLDAKCTVVAPDLFLTGEYGSAQVAWPPQQGHRDIPFMGFRYGYNRTILAERVHDILTTVAHLHQRRDVDQLDLIAWGGAGPWGLLARSQARRLVNRCVLDLEGWDFDQVQNLEDPQLLPGAMRYGGVWGAVPLCGDASGARTVLCRMPPSKAAAVESLARSTPGVALQAETPTLARLVDELLK